MMDGTIRAMLLRSGLRPSVLGHQRLHFSHLSSRNGTLLWAVDLWDKMAGAILP